MKKGIKLGIQAVVLLVKLLVNVVTQVVLLLWLAYVELHLPVGILKWAGGCLLFAIWYDLAKGLIMKSIKELIKKFKGPKSS